MGNALGALRMLGHAEHQLAASSTPFAVDDPEGVRGAVQHLVPGASEAAAAAAQLQELHDKAAQQGRTGGPSMHASCQLS